MKFVQRPYPIVVKPRLDATIHDIAKAAHVLGFDPHIVLSHLPTPAEQPKRRAKKRKASR